MGIGSHCGAGQENSLITFWLGLKWLAQIANVSNRLLAQQRMIPHAAAV